ncbi:hypothetical protein CLV79_11532 [Limimaricola soesokkakensis]|uniref:HTH DNA binding domain-containing protein n=1 Tax=Limimaricola soesokkakensis TaxID=1343159 RepID=A0A1X7A0Q2_9RHOB|nr:hypothetical protein [Limimaricola soesokkakensis]PSK81564.1 hypothetical protein CLV79_11532 [Limimaricola soesokkakensis]SLN67288.1 hypothetical protein LOS8367_03355 [Limimaricola soesokkakensis]
MAFEDTEKARSAVSTFMRAEVLAARLEAMARAEPEVGNLWRSEIALAEAVASAGLEGIRISEGDLLPRIALNGSQDADPTGAELALSLIRVLKAPGDPLARPVQTVRRFERAAGTGMGPGVDPDDEPEGQRLEDAEIEGLFADLRPGDMPILTAARAAADYAALSQRANPIVERLIFMAVDSSLRGRAARRADPEDVLRGLSGRVDAQWVSSPALALSHRGFLPWSPGSEAGLMTLGTHLAGLFEAEIGRFALSRDWLRRGQEAARGRGGRSRMADAIQAFGTAPVLSSALLAETIGVSIRTALTLLGEMTELGLLQEITGRKTARIWAVPSLGGRLAARLPRRAWRKGQMQISPAEGRETAQQRSFEGRQADQKAMERVFTDLDAALARADALLIGVRRKALSRS